MNCIFSKEDEWRHYPRGRPYSKRYWVLWGRLSGKSPKLLFVLENCDCRLRNLDAVVLGISYLI